MYVYILADNFSRFILSYRAALDYSAKYSFENLVEAQQTLKIFEKQDEIDLIVDDGSENKAKVDSFVDENSINKIVAQKDIICSNSMIEAINKRLKYDYLFTEELQNYEQTTKYLVKAVDEYNNKPHNA